MKCTKYFHGHGCLWCQGSRWPPPHLEELNIRVRSAWAATEIHFDNVDSVVGNNDKIVRTMLNEGTKSTGGMPQLKSKSQVLECYASKMSMLPFLYYESPLG